MNATQTRRQHDPTLCPTWCSGEHLTTRLEAGGDFHHDQVNASLLASRDGGPAGDAYVFVSVSQFQPEDGPAWPVQVELTAQEQTTVLTPAEARHCARMLLDAADTAEGRPPATTAHMRAELARISGVLDQVCARLDAEASHEVTSRD